MEKNVSEKNQNLIGAFEFTGRCGGCGKHCPINGACILNPRFRVLNEFEFYFKTACGERWWKRHPFQVRREFERCIREEKFNELPFHPFYDYEEYEAIGNPIHRYVSSALRMKAEIFFEAARRVRKLFSLA